ncbi:hypothetical protein BJY00DRAFT_327055 [Aspergillus carlsbadensis]|nr:hypothetical protein BJY00DRAFT_327055 [Aspergillus carlsbadensis]
MNVASDVRLCRVDDDPKSISAVANTITLAFANDPLIKWLRPLAPVWTSDQADTYRWQYRRVRRAIAEGIVLQSESVPEEYQQSLLPTGSRSNSTAALGSHTSGDDRGLSNGDRDAETAVLLFPPKSRRKWTLSRRVLIVKLWLLDMFDPVAEKGTSPQRLETMMTTHERSTARIKTQYQMQDAWYLEVVAVHPRLQGRALGKKVMRSILDVARDEPILLECTRKSNIGFYRSLGFEVVEEVELADGDEGVKLWFMLRQTSQQTDAQ